MEPYEIGFNDQIEADHVQTEVLGKREYKIKTLVTSGGVVTHETTQIWPGEIDTADLYNLAKTQHAQVIAQLRSGNL